jgi:hypothetical protein
METFGMAITSLDVLDPDDLNFLIPEIGVNA